MLNGQNDWLGVEEADTPAVGTTSTEMPLSLWEEGK